MFVIRRKSDGKLFTDPKYPYTEERCWSLDKSKARVYKSGKSSKYTFKCGIRGWGSCPNKPHTHTTYRRRGESEDTELVSVFNL